MSCVRRYYKWSRGQVRPHETLATRNLELLLGFSTQAVRQKAFTGPELRADLTVDGKDASFILPQPLASSLVDRHIIIELESRKLSLKRLQRMSLMASYAEINYQEIRAKNSHEPQRKKPLSLAYVVGTTLEVQRYIVETPFVGIYSYTHLDIEHLIVDNSEVPRDSPYVHLKLLHAPRVIGDKEAFKRAVGEQIDDAVKYSELSPPLLQEFIMNALEQLTPNLEDKNSVVRRSPYKNFFEMGKHVGNDEGRKDEKLATTRDHILLLAKTKGFSLDEKSLAKVNESTNLKQLKKWMIAVATAESPQSKKLKF